MDLNGSTEKLLLEKKMAKSSKTKNELITNENNALIKEDTTKNSSIKNIKKPKLKVEKGNPDDPKIKREIFNEKGEFKIKFREYEVLVSNCPFEATEEIIKNHFLICPKIKQVKLSKRFDGKFSGRCFIKLSNQVSLESALSLNGSKILGRNIYVEKTKSTIDSEYQCNKKNGIWINEESDSKENLQKSIFVTNLEESVNEETLKNHFFKFGEIEFVRLISNEQNNYKKFAFVDFLLSESAREALKSGGTILNGRSLKISYAFQKTSNSLPRDILNNEHKVENCTNSHEVQNENIIDKPSSVLAENSLGEIVKTVQNPNNGNVLSVTSTTCVLDLLLKEEQRMTSQTSIKEFFGDKDDTENIRTEVEEKLDNELKESAEKRTKGLF